MTNEDKQEVRFNVIPTIQIFDADVKSFHVIFIDFINSI